MNSLYFARVSFLLLSLFVTAACNKKSDSSSSTDNSEIGQSVGDTMSSVDEAGGSGGTIGMNSEVKEAQRLYAKFFPGDALMDRIFSAIRSEAVAATCLGAGFSSCSNNAITRTFGGCKLGLLTFDGTVSLTWGGSSASCAMAAANDTITRVPDFKITGPNGGTFTVSKTATVGQQIKWVSGSGTTKVMEFTNDGIRRVVKNSGGTTLYDFTTEVTSPITVTGTTRSNRVISGGTLKVTNNTTAKTCTLAPTSVTWDGTCTCAISGQWDGTCDSTTSSVKIDSCGKATVTINGTAQFIDLDRCIAI